MEMYPALNVVVLSDSLIEHQCLPFLAGMAIVFYPRIEDRF
jgi:hypothetical protein